MTEKKIVNDDTRKYVEITKHCLLIEIPDKRLQFLQTKHLQCTRKDLCTPLESSKNTCLKTQMKSDVSVHWHFYSSDGHGNLLVMPCPILLLILILQ